LKSNKIYQFVWDEKILQIFHLDSTQAHIWSSSTLYNQQIKLTRAKIFKQFVTQEPNSNQVLDFHKVNVNNDLHQSFFVNIDNTIKTVAITQVTGKPSTMQVKYTDYY
jgi:LEA14-like dessication related protein